MIRVILLASAIGLLLYVCEVGQPKLPHQWHQTCLYDAEGDPRSVLCLPKYRDC